MIRSTFALLTATCCAVLVPTAAHARLPFGAEPQDQSTFAMGDVTLNVVFVESDGSIDANQEDWSAEQLDQVRQEIAAATAFWEEQTAAFHPHARLSFNVQYVNQGVPVTSGYEPITRAGAVGSAGVWLDDVMSRLGYAGANYRQAASQFNHESRIAHDTNWASTLIVVNDLVDEDNRFADQQFAWTLMGGPVTVLTYENNGWGADRFHRVLAHELGHTFFALDEYAASGVREHATSGYLKGVNGNAEINRTGQRVTPPQPDALMLNAVLDPSPFTRVQVGWLDGDDDGVPDILDTVPMLSGDADLSDPLSGAFVFTGQARVNPLENNNPSNAGRSNSRSAITINWIESSAYNLDGLGWIDALAADGRFDDGVEGVQFSLTGLARGEHEIEVLATNSVGNSSEVLRFTFQSLVPEPGAMLLATVGLLSMLVISRRRGK